MILHLMTKTLTHSAPFRTLAENMWARFRHYFKGFPAQEKVAQLMVMYGLRVHEGSVCAAEIVPTNASKPGILAGVAAIIAQAGISIRQVIMDDPEIVDDPHGFIVTEAPVPERLLPQIKQVDGVKSVVLH